MKNFQIILILLCYQNYLIAQDYLIKDFTLNCSKQSKCKDYGGVKFNKLNTSFINDSCIFYSENIKNTYESFYCEIPYFINSEIKESRKFDCIILNTLKNKNDIKFKSPKSFLNILEIFYKSQEMADKVFNSLKLKDQIEYAVTQVDWSFFLTNKKSIIIVFSEGYRQNTLFRRSINNIIEEKASIKDKKNIIDNSKSID